MPERTIVDIDGIELSLSNLDKVLYPEVGFTKAEVIEYYRRIAPVMVPHIAARPMTLKRYPNGVEGGFFFEKNCPSHRPPWVETIDIMSSGRRSGRNREELIRYCRIESAAHLVWTANLAALELHPGLQTAEDLGRPSWVVFDLDPGPGTDETTCGEIGLMIRDLLEQMRLQSLIKTSGSKGLQLYVPLNTPGVTFADTSDFALRIGQALEQRFPDRVTTNMAKQQRPGRIFVDWSQNAFTKTTIAVYSLRARAHPTVSTPVTWDEVSEAVEAGDARRLRFDSEDVLGRVEAHGDLFGALLTTKQELPALG
jgi:bifunctional non-homologous end joining protein LigD